MKRFISRVWQRIRRLGRRPDAERFSEIGLLHRFLVRGGEKGRVMIDVGAQFGESFTPFVRKGWQVLAFEPDPDARKQEALAALAGKKVTVVRRALAENACAAAPFFASEVSTGISALVPFHDSHRAVGQVEVSTLAVELARAKINRVDFLKIDTEGHDLFVLKGFPWARPELRPRVVLCEYENAKTQPLGYTWEEMADFLVARGYAVLVSEWKPIVRYGVSHDWVGLQRYPAARVNPAGWGNLIALSTASDLDWLEREASLYPHS